MNRLFGLLFAAVFALSFLSLPFAYAAPSTAEAALDTGAPISMSEGEVKKVNKDAGKITIKHGELKNLDMPPMTMVFLVQDPSMLDQVNPGDKINFVADKVEGKFTVTKIEIKK